MVDYDIGKILQALPHRYPLLLVDRVRSITLGERIHAVKAVSMNEQFFSGPFPRSADHARRAADRGAGAGRRHSLGIETMELAGTGKLVIFMGIENAKFRSPVTPGCLLDLHVEFTQKRSRVLQVQGCGERRGQDELRGRVHCDDDRSACLSGRDTSKVAFDREPD